MKNQQMTQEEIDAYLEAFEIYNREIIKGVFVSPEWYKFIFGAGFQAGVNFQKKQLENKTV